MLDGFLFCPIVFHLGLHGMALSVLRMSLPYLVNSLWKHQQRQIQSCVFTDRSLGCFSIQSSWQPRLIITSRKCSFNFCPQNEVLSMVSPLVKVKEGVQQNLREPPCLEENVINTEPLNICVLISTLLLIRNEVWVSKKRRGGRTMRPT